MRRVSPLEAFAMNDSASSSYSMPSRRSSVDRMTREMSDETTIVAMNHVAIFNPSGRSMMLRMKRGRCFTLESVTATAADDISISTPVAYAPPCFSTSASKMIVTSTEMAVISRTRGRVARAQSGAMP
jgi:hypothetical protein